MLRTGLIALLQTNLHRKVHFREGFYYYGFVKFVYHSDKESNNCDNQYTIFSYWTTLHGTSKNSAIAAPHKLTGQHSLSSSSSSSHRVLNSLFHNAHQAKVATTSTSYSLGIIGGLGADASALSSSFP